MSQLTEKQHAFVLAYIETGNAAEAYRRSYDIKRMSPTTLQKRASELLHHGGIAGRIAELRKRVIEKVLIDRVWVIERLVENCEIAMGRKMVKRTVKGSAAAMEVCTVEVYDRDAAAANASLKLLGQLPEIGLFNDAGPAAVNVANNLKQPQPQTADRIAEVVQRFRGAH